MKINLNRKNPSPKNKDFVTPVDEIEEKSEIIMSIVNTRIEKKLSQRDLAKKIGIAQSSLARFESCRTNPTLSFLQKITAALDLELNINRV